MRTQAENDYNYLIAQPRKNVGLVTRTFAKATLDAMRIVSNGQKPFSLGQGLYEGCRNIADYCADNNMGNIIMVDKSARPLWVGISTYWKLAHEDRTRPQISFINPTSFRGAIHSSESPAELTERIRSTGRTCMEELTSSGSPLAENTDKPVMLADACLHSGKAVYLTRRVLEAAGFSDVRVGVIKTTLPHNAPYVPDVYGTDNILSAHCFRSDPYDGLVRNDEQSTYSAAVTDPEISSRGAAIRHRIATMITERYALEQAQ